jgi:NAD(P)-dependent dehydrogenase (short-subunit alcohol dehydrogenase family)
MILKNSKVVIVGGSSGIGEASARLFLEAGANVIIAGRSREKMDAAVKRLGKAQGIIADGTSPESVKKLFEATGQFDHLVLALSGGKGAGPISKIPLDDIRSGFEAKFFAQLTALQAALPFLKNSVVFISAASAAAAIPGTSGLAAINGAIESVVRPLSVELAPIRVNAVRPGVIDTPWWNGVPPEFKTAVFAQTSQALPVKRVGKPEDVAKAVVMAADNSFVTGTVIDVSGGATLAR